ncbi:MAG TPA: hypothetical protein VLM18_03390 [Croceibacterium sp.]|nr:hypothetical protein [Croceibacterium sp.]
MRLSNDEYPVQITGEYVSEDDAFHPIVLTRLSMQHCIAAQCADAPAPGSRVSLWIGALGPWSAKVDEASRASLRLRFEAPLDALVLLHFVGH